MIFGIGPHTMAMIFDGPRFTNSGTIYGDIQLERVDIQDSHGLATLIQAPFGRRLG